MSKPPLNYAPPPRNGTTSDRSAAREWAAEADTQPNKRKPASTGYKPGDLDFLSLPHDREWNIVNVRLTDREKGALKWLAEHSPESMHTICKRVVKAEINRMLREKGIKEVGPVEG